MANLLDSIFSVLIVPSLAFYVLFLACLMRYRKALGARFFDILISVGVSDVIYTIVVTTSKTLTWYFSTAGAQQPWAPETRQFYKQTLESAAWPGCYLLQVLGVAAMTANRFTALVLPMKHQKIWAPTSSLVLTLGIQWGASALVGLTLAVYPHFAVVPSNGSWTGYARRSEGSATMYTFFAVIETAIGALVLFAYGYMLLTYMKHRKAQVGAARDASTSGASSSTSSAAARASSVEAKLAAIGLVLGLCITVQTATSLLVVVREAAATPAWLAALVGGLHANVEDYVLPFVRFAFTFSNPVLTLAFSAAARACFKEFVRLGA